VDFASIVRRRLEELGIEQRELALAAQVTESYISQLLAKKKTPPSSERTDLYDKIAKTLKLSSKDLAKLADAQRREELKRRVIDPPQPLYPELRQFLLHKCVAAAKKPTAHLFERETFGEFERLIAHNLLELAKRVIRQQVSQEQWLYRLARLAKLNAGKAKVAVLDLLKTDLVHLSIDEHLPLLGVFIESWEMDLASFSLEILLNSRLTSSYVKRLAFREDDGQPRSEAGVQPGLAQFLSDEKLCAGISPQEREFLASLSFKGKQPSPLFYYRELQNLRDPLNFFPVTIVRQES
jgi:transcriptional regulator with XRE-family HTH domain